MVKEEKQQQQLGDKTNILNHESKLAVKNEVWKSQNMW